MIRQPIISVMGHVDHGKTSLLDKIRNTTMVNREAGRITQHIGASEVPIDVVNKICGKLMRNASDIKLPGLLFIDTPGHEAFTNLRRRGGSVSDLAILVVDITKNFEPQTYEAVEILKEYKTPFIVAANKIDLITGWIPNNTYSFLESLSKQHPGVIEAEEARIYEIIGKLSEIGFSSERADRVTDFTKEISIVPVSAKTGEGLAELLMYATGISQKFLEMRLNIEISGPGRGSILEKKEEKGLGLTLDVILYNGSLNVNDVVAFATSSGVKTSKIKALLKPKPLNDIREAASKFYYVEHVDAASGVKLCGSGLEDALPGSLLISTQSEGYESEIKSELSEVFGSEKEGVILKADTIGSIEAISRLLGSEGIHISKKEIGKVTKRDLADAFSMKSTDPYAAIILAFNVPVEDEIMQDAASMAVPLISSNIIYKLLDDYREWKLAETKRSRSDAEKLITLPGLLSVMPNHCFRISHPAVFGVSVSAGKVKPGYQLMNKYGEIVGRIKGMQNNGVNIPEIKAGEEAAVSMDGITFGRQIKDSDELYTFINDEEEMLIRNKYSELLDEGSTLLLDTISKIKRESKARRHD